MRIALCGYEGEGHEALEARGWRVVRWCAGGGMSKDKGVGSGGNNEREAVWFSPACEPLTDAAAAALAAAADDGSGAP